MDIRDFGIDERLIAALPGLQGRAQLHETMLRHAVAGSDNVLARIEVALGREEISLLPAFHWLLSGPEGEARRVLLAAPDRAASELVAATARRLGSGLGLAPCLVTPAEESEGGPGAAPVFEGDPGSALVIGPPTSLLEAAESGLLRLKDFGFLVVEGAERIAELPPESLKAFSSALRPSWERRCILSCAKLGQKAKNLAWELADNPVEIHVEEEAAKAQGVAQESWLLRAEEKLPFLLGLLVRSAPARIAVFCDLKGSAEELALRLEHNGVPAEYILGALPLDRKAALLEKLRSGESRVLVLTDQGAEGLAPSSFPLLVNFEIPLEPELYLKRLELLDRGAAGAKLVNLACERYAVGLPAIEGYIRASLAARPVDPSLLGAEDLSAAFVYERPSGSSSRGGRRGGSRAGRLVPPPTRAPAAERSRDGRPAARPEGRREGGGEPPRGPSPQEARRSRRGGRPAEERDREDRRPEIWRSIAEATGGDIGRESFGPASPGGSSGEASPAGPASEGRERTEGRGSGRSGRGGGKSKPRAASREPERARKKGKDEGAEAQKPRGKASGRGGRAQDGAARGGSPREGSAGGGAPRGKSRESATRAKGRGAGNPYDLPMEERMRRYREKYGAAPEGEAGGSRRERPAGRSGEGRPEPAPGRGGARGPSPSDRESGRRGGQPGRPEAPPRPAPSKEGEERSPGLLGRLLGVFKRKGE